MKLMSSYLSSLKTYGIVAMMLGILMLNSCQKDLISESPTNVGTVRFASNAYTIENNTIEPLTVVLPLSLPLEQDATVLISVDGSSTVSSGEYTISPALPTAGLTLTLPKGATEVSFKVNSLNNFEGEKTLVLKLSSATGGVTIANTNATATITIKGNPIILPEIKTSTSSLAFGNVITTTNSASQPYTVTGVKLTSNLNITASTNFQVSLDNVVFASTVSIPFATANASPVTVYARFRALTGVNQTVSGTIAHSSGTLPDNTVTLSAVEYGVAAPGVLLKNDDFNYGATGGGLVAKSGGTWIPFPNPTPGTTPTVQYVSPGLTYTGYVGSGIGGALVSENGSGSREDVGMTFPSQTDGVIYTAQLINFTSAPAAADFFLSIGDGISGATPVYYNRIYAKTAGSQISLGIGRNSATAVYVSNNLDVGTTYLVVHKYEFASGNSSLYVLSGPPSAIEPPTAGAISTATGNPSAMTRVIIRQNAGILKATVDGIRVATSWKEAVGL
jgi:hypothetical protein